MIKEEKQRITVLNILTYISIVIDSCETIEQLENAKRWGINILKNHITFHVMDYSVFDRTKILNKNKSCQDIIIAKYKMKLNKLKNDI